MDTKGIFKEWGNVCILAFLTDKINTMAFDGTEGGAISLSTAAELTGNYRKDNPGQKLAHYYGRDIINELLSQEGCVGIRIYYGTSEDGDKELVLVGVDSDENDMLALVADTSVPCPNYCSTPNALNS